MPLVDRPRHAASRRPGGQRPAVARRNTTRPPRQRELTGGVTDCVGVDVTEGTPVCVWPTGKYPDGRTGTTAGYAAHQVLGERACGRCMAAWAARCAELGRRMSPDALARRAEGKGASQRRLRAERATQTACGDAAGTMAGHKAHVEAGQYACKPCREAMASSGMACAFPTINYPDGRTGTSAGYQAHRDNGQPSCRECTDAFSAKMIARRRALCGEDLALYRAGNAAATRRRRTADPQKIRVQQHRTIDKNRAAVREAKDKPCADCGIHYPYYVMEFDHLDSGAKHFNISAGVTCASYDRIIAEIAKCEVVCANCHAERTHRRRQEQLPERAPTEEAIA